MLLLRTERFAVDPDWSRISECHLNRAQELVNLIKEQCYLSRVYKGDDYYNWILELKGMLDEYPLRFDAGKITPR